MDSSTPKKSSLTSEAAKGALACTNIKMEEDFCMSSSLSDLSASLSSEKTERRNFASKDEFWDALSSHYDYLMDDGLIATCREASSDLSWDDDDEITKNYCWSFTHFIEQFKCLHDMLHHLQVGMQGSSKECILEEQKRVGYFCKHFNEQGHKLSKRYPDMRDEVNRHLNLLNNKWEAVEQSINPNRPQPAKDSAFSEITTQMRCLRRWLRELEERLCPVALSSKWSLEKLEVKQNEQQGLQKEIEAKGKYVTALLKLCECLDGSVTYEQHSLLRWNAEGIQRVAKNLQHRWHSIWLQSLECQYVVANLISQVKAGSAENILDSSFSEEPVKKYPRLSDGNDGPLILRSEYCVEMNAEVKSEDDVFVADPVVRKTNKWLQSCRKSSAVCSTKEKIVTNDKGVMVGNTGIVELKAKCNGNIGKFEIVQDVGYSSETSTHLSNDEQGEITNIAFCTYDSGTTAKPSSSSPESFDQISSLPASKRPSGNIILAPDKYPAFNLKRHLFFSEDKPLTDARYTKCVPGSFYRMTSLDADSCEDLTEGVSLNPSVDVRELSKQDGPVTNEESSFQACDVVQISSVGQKAKISPVSNNTDFNRLSTSDSISGSPNSTLKSSQKDNKGATTPDTSKTLPQCEKVKRTARVREWLNNCKSGDELTSEEALEARTKGRHSDGNVIDSSCDASGEYTSTESDGEKSAVSDDVNNSLSFSQSFTGSVETVVPVSKEQPSLHNDRAGSAEPSPCVRLRKKKKHSRDRPWSVIEVNQVSIQPARFTHSTSEGALNSLVYMQDNEKTVPCSKKRCLRREKLSLTDMSTTGFPSIEVSSCRRAGALPQQCGHHSDGSDCCRRLKNDVCTTSNKLSDSVANVTSVDGKDEVTVVNSSDRNSVSSCNSSTSKPRGQNRNKRRLKSSQSEGSPKQKSNSEGSSTEKKVASQVVASEPKSPMKCTSNPSCPEDQSSVSDQVWDEYQDPPYLSEPYSEQTADEDQVRRLINFGDDYRAILGSHSDASSAKSVCKTPAKSRVRSVPFSIKDNFLQHSKVPSNGSDSDTEDFHNILATSLRALHFVRNCTKENMAKDNFAFSSEFAELVATCQTNVCHLHAIQEELISKPNFQSFSSEDLHKLQDLIRDWEVLQAKLVSLPLQKNGQLASTEHVEAAVMDVQSTITAYKGQLNAIWGCASDALSAISCSKDLENNIQALQTGLATLQEMKGAVLSVSAKIVRLMAESGSEAVFPLREGAARLYQQWEDVYELSSSQLTKLQALQSRWVECSEKDLEKRLETVLQFQNSESGYLSHMQSISSENIKSEVVEAKAVSKSSLMPPQVVKCGTDCTDSTEEVVRLLPFCPSSFNYKKPEENEVEETNGSKVSDVNTRSRLWRALRAAMPIQFALVISYCLSCLMEPQCCENMNTFDFSVFPQLRHVQGPPPV